MRAIKDDRIRWRVHVLEFAPWADLPLASVTRLHAREWLSMLALRRSSCPRHRRRGRRLAAQTLRNVLNLVRRCFADAVEDELAPFNPFDSLRVHRSRGASTVEASTILLPLEQLAGLGALARHPERWMVAFAMYSTIRQGEQWSLRLEDVIDLDGPRPRLRVWFGSAGSDDEDEDGPTKGGRACTIPLLHRAADALRRWLALLPAYAPKNPRRLVFPTRSGRRRSKGKTFRAWRYLEMAVGRHVRWHDLRHTGATSLAAGWWGSPAWTLEALRRLLRHSSVTVTEKYARIVRELAFDAAARMAPQPVSRVDARRRVGHRTTWGAEMDNSNHVDAATAASETPEDGAVAKWSGIGLQNRLPSPAGVQADPSEYTQAACEARAFGSPEAARVFVDDLRSILQCDEPQPTLARAREVMGRLEGAIVSHDELNASLFRALTDTNTAKGMAQQSAAKLAELRADADAQRATLADLLKECGELREQRDAARAASRAFTAKLFNERPTDAPSVSRVDVVSPSLHEGAASNGAAEREEEAPNPRAALDGLFNGAAMGLGGVRAAKLVNIVRAALNGVEQRSTQHVRAASDGAAERGSIARRLRAYAARCAPGAVTIREERLAIAKHVQGDFFPGESADDLEAVIAERVEQRSTTEDLTICTGCGVRERDTREGTLFGGLCGKCDAVAPPDEQRSTQPKGEASDAKAEGRSAREEEHSNGARAGADLDRAPLVHHDLVRGHARKVGGVREGDPLAERTLGAAPLRFAVGDRVRERSTGRTGVVRRFDKVYSGTAHAFELVVVHLDEVNEGTFGVPFLGVLAEDLDIVPTSVHRSATPLRAPLPGPDLTEDAFRATELGAAVSERETTPELGSDMLRGALAEARRERDDLAGRLSDLAVRHREAIDLLTDVDRAADAIGRFLDRSVKR